MDDPARLQRERDLYLRLLELGQERDLTRSLREALRLAVEVTGAERGYIELSTDADSEPFRAVAGDESGQAVSQILERTSRTIVQEALASGQRIHVPSALLDSRFADRRSVVRQGIEAVLCVPIEPVGLSGVFYLQRPAGAGNFSDADVELVETFVRCAQPMLLRLATEEREKRSADPTAKWREKVPAPRLIGRSPAMAEVLRMIATFAHLELTVLLTGPSGTGKTSIARTIHDASPRKNGPFVVVSCAALQPTLAENELFGAMPGAHSAALQRVRGRVLAADGGTLFLDDVNTLPLEVQAKLLTLLQDKTFVPLGGSEALKADIRIIAATNEDLAEMVAAGEFRADLRYRLDVGLIRVPSLAERREDVIPLARFLAEQAAATNRLPALGLTPWAEQALEAAEWPGNVRELENKVARGLALAAGEGLRHVEVRHLFPEQLSTGDPESLTFHEATRRFQAQLIRRTLEQCDWNRSAAARKLDLGRTYFLTLMRTHGITQER
ncbi:sigma-54-dependent Fis family transcriptional regulator [Myxococcota bacterium]|nr:sigma-54-dependent Fis family transcriptional regulator [Myxococcota bacterium]